jgi:hypothetical protein
LLDITESEHVLDVGCGSVPVTRFVSKGEKDPSSRAACISSSGDASRDETHRPPQNMGGVRGRRKDGTHNEALQPTAGSRCSPTGRSAPGR